MSATIHAIEQRARRAAKRIGLIATKSRRRTRRPGDNYGGFQLVDVDANIIVGGSRFSMTAEDVLKYCRGAA
jgi:hypothetical protein